jgi:predicted transcriptional regulator
MNQTNITEKLTNLVEEAKEDNLQVNIFSKKRTIKPSQDFVMVFHSNFYDLVDEFKLANNDLKVLLTIFNYLSFGNVINLTLKTIEKKTGIDKANISRIIKKLETAKILYRDKEKSLFLNPMYIVKGSLSSVKDSDIYRQVRNEIYNELKESFKDDEELQKAVYSKLPF